MQQTGVIGAKSSASVVAMSPKRSRKPARFRWAAMVQCVLYNQTIETGCVSRTGIVRGSFKKEFP